MFTGQKPTVWSAMESTALIPASPPQRPLLPCAVETHDSGSVPGKRACPAPAQALGERVYRGDCFCLGGLWLPLCPGLGFSVLSAWSRRWGWRRPSQGPGWPVCRLRPRVARWGGPEPLSLTRAHVRPSAGERPALPGVMGHEQERSLHFLLFLQRRQARQHSAG